MNQQSYIGLLPLTFTCFFFSQSLYDSVLNKNRKTDRIEMKLNKCILWKSHKILLPVIAGEMQTPVE